MTEILQSFGELYARPSYAHALGKTLRLIIGDKLNQILSYEFDI